MKREYDITGVNEHGETVTERITVEETGGLPWPKAILWSLVGLTPVYILTAAVVWAEELDRALTSLWFKLQFAWIWLMLAFIELQQNVLRWIVEHL